MHDLIIAYITVVTVMGLPWTILNIAHLVDREPTEYRFYGLLLMLATLFAFQQDHWFYFTGTVFGVGSIAANLQELGFRKRKGDIE